MSQREVGIMKYKDYAAGYLNIQQGSIQHKQVIDLYNCITPRPRGYKMNYSDAWCAAFATVCMDQCHGINVPRECSVPEMWKKCKGRTVKSPAVDDLIFYDWNNDGTPDHVGIVYDAGNTYVVAIEGNKSNRVGTRVITKNSKSIFGYAHISRVADGDELESIANKVIQGYYGNGNARKRRLVADGYDPDTVQKKVNEILKK